LNDTDVQHYYDPEGLNVGTWPLDHTGALSTPPGRFFKRNHAVPPRIDPDTWCLEVGGLVNHAAAYSLTDLTTRFARRDIEATLICAGLRRAELLELGPLPGELPWSLDAASNGRWGGVSLAEVLRASGVADTAQHVEFVGLDRVERHGQHFGFGGSIEIEKALSAEVLLATHLNDEPLPREHGFPLRAIVPGWIGARSVKWLSRITVLPQPSTNYFQAQAYRIQKAMNPADPRDVSAGEAMGEIPLNALILEPRPNAIVAAGPVHIRGWAIGSGCQPLTAVEVGLSGTSSWVRAELLTTPSRWAWRPWEAVVSLPPGTQTLIARAVDPTGMMPADIQATWNVKGYGNNAWHRVLVTAN